MQQKSVTKRVSGILLGVVLGATVALPALAAADGEGAEFIGNAALPAPTVSEVRQAGLVSASPFEVPAVLPRRVACPEVRCFHE